MLGLVALICDVGISGLEFQGFGLGFRLQAQVLGFRV